MAGGRSVSAAAALSIAALAERVAKLHAQIGLGVLAERSRRALAATLADFDAALSEVAAVQAGAEVRDNYLLLAMLWREYRDTAVRPAGRETARRLRERCEEVVWIATKGARLVQESAREAQNAWALRAAQVAVMSQRIPKLYLWRRWEIDDEGTRKELREAEDNLARTLEALREAPGLTEESAAQLQLAQTQLAFMREAARELARSSTVPRQLEFLAKTGDYIFEAMEKLRRALESRP